MLSIRTLLQLLNPGNAIRYLNTMLALAIIPFIDYFILAELSVITGKYLFLALLLLLTFSGFFLALYMLRKNLQIIKINLMNHYYSEYYYCMFPGTLIVAFFLIMPGIIGTVLSLVFCIPVLRYTTGKKISFYLNIEWKEIHEYINIMD